MAKKLAAAGIQIISGMALGIDGAGHEGAMAAGGMTYAVLGCGVDQCYPRSNFDLYENIPFYGGLISEYPLKHSHHAQEIFLYAIVSSVVFLMLSHSYRGKRKKRVAYYCPVRLRTGKRNLCPSRPDHRCFKYRMQPADRRRRPGSFTGNSS